MEDHAVDQISTTIDRNHVQFTESLWTPLDSYPAKPSTSMTTKKFLEADQEQREQRQAEQQRQEARRMARKKRPKPEDLQEAEQQHQELLRRNYQSKFADTLKSQEPTRTDIARKNREALQTYGKKVQSDNRTVLPLIPKQKPPVEEEPEWRPPPTAVDLKEWSRRVNSESRELTALQNRIAVDERESIDVRESFEKIAATELQVAEAGAGADYHLQFAMLFQKMDDAEVKIREVEERADALQ
jgi:uncharacterized protein YnzC (UPF0291/DUF896 family)